MLRIIQETYPLILVPFSLLISEKNIEKWEAINEQQQWVCIFNVYFS